MVTVIPSVVTAIAAVLVLHAPSSGQSLGQPDKCLLGYVNQLAPESGHDRALRHAIVAQRRQGPIVLVHRGASAFAPENTLEAFAAAMDLGADGFECDVRRTADDVLITFHDPHLHRMLDGFGSTGGMHYYELLGHDFYPRYGRADRRTRVPTLISALELARQRAALLFLDIKETGIDEELAGLLDEADMWDHVVTVYGAIDHIATRPELQTLSWKAGHLYLTGRDWDPAAIVEDLALPGEILFVNDPRAAVMVLGRSPWDPVPLPTGIRAWWQPSRAPLPGDPSQRTAIQVIRDLQNRIDADCVADLLLVLGNADLVERFTPDGDEAYQQARVHRLIERSWAARRLGQLGEVSPAVVDALQAQIRGRTLHRHWSYKGLDANMAAEALARLDHRPSARMLMDWHDSEHPELATIASSSGDPIEWLDRGSRYAMIEALGELRTWRSSMWLWQYLHSEVDAFHPPHIGGWQVATVALLKHRPRPAQLFDVLTNDDGVIRAQAIMGCVDGRIPWARWMLWFTHRWALSVPRAEDPSRYR